MADLFIVAGETSGDQLGAAVARDFSHLKLSGVAGPQMRAAGVQPIVPMEALQTMGLSQVLFSLPRLISLFYTIKRAIIKANPKVILFIDYPDFNLRLAKSLSLINHPAQRIHYVCPSVWAWKKHRAAFMAQHFDSAFALFPFEPAYFPFDVHYVGHPMVNQITPTPPGDLLAIFPGSREGVIRRNLPLQLAAAQAFGKRKIAISCAHNAYLPLIHRLAPGIPIFSKEKLLRQTHLAIATCGTIALELALYHIPTLITYVISSFDAFIANKIFTLDLPFYSLPNILLKGELFPEHIGPSLAPIQIIESLFDIAARADGIRTKAAAVKKALPPPQYTASQLLSRLY